MSRRAFVGTAGAFALTASRASVAKALSSSELIGLGAAEAAKRIAAGDIRAESYVDALLQWQTCVSALDIIVAQDRDALLDAARAVDVRRSTGRPLGALAGVPLLVKDNIDTAGLPTTAGTPRLADNRPRHDAAVLTKLLNAGGLLFAKTNMDELAMGATGANAATGTIRNPYAEDRVAGGSSGGTAAGLAARLTPAGLGTDTGGSVRIPASLCGVVGFRPSVDRYPSGGHVPSSHTRDVIGPMARSVADVVLLDGIMSGRVPAATASLQGLRLGLPRAFYWSDLDPETDAVARDAVRRMADAGATLVDVDLPDLPGLLDQIGPILPYEAVADLREYLAESTSKASVEQVVAGMASPGPAAFYRAFLASAGDVDVYRRAVGVGRPRLQSLFADAFARLGLSALCFPSTPVAAVKVGQDTVNLGGKAVPVLAAYFRNCNPGSAAGLPGLTVPAGLTRSGLPVGIEFDGPAGSDAHLLAVGAAAAAVLPPLPAPRIVAVTP